MFKSQKEMKAKKEKKMQRRRRNWNGLKKSYSERNLECKGWICVKKIRKKPVVYASWDGESRICNYQFLGQLYSSFLVASFLSWTAPTKYTDPLKLGFSFLHFSVSELWLSLCSLSMMICVKNERVENENKVDIYLNTELTLTNAWAVLLVRVFILYLFSWRVFSVRAIYLEGEIYDL